VLQSDCALEMRFTDLSLDKLWISAKQEYPVDDELHVCLSKIELRIMHLCSKRQAKVSH
jgi:hypothetical protein